MAGNNTKIIVSAEDKASKVLGDVSNKIGELAEKYKNELVAALSVGAFTAMIKSTITAADEMNDLSQKVGIAVKDLGTWKLAAESSGTSMEAVAKGVKGLSGYMHDHAKELKAAGITATDAGGAMTQLADIFKAMPDGVEKTNLAVKLFGKAGMDLLPMMNLGSAGLKEMQEKAAEYGKRLAILAPQADKFDDLLAEMSLQSKVLGINIGIELVPSLIKFAEQLMEGKKIAGGWTAAMWEFGVLLDPTKGIPESLNQTRVQLEKLHAEMAKGQAQNLADGGMTDLSEIDRNIGLGTRRKAYLEFMQRQSVMEGAGKLGDYRDARDLRLANGATMSVAEALARAKKLNPTDPDKKHAGIYGPDDVLYNIEEAVRKQNRAAIIKDQADEEKALAEAIKESNKALSEHADKLGKDVAAAEKALETYGLTESQIADLTLARLKHAKAMEAEQDADEATLGWYDREIEALERIRAAKFAIEAKDIAKKEAEDAAKAWQNFARDLESSLTDALMRSFESGKSFGQAFMDNLKNLFKTAILKAVVQIGVGTVAAGAASVANAAGIDTKGITTGTGGIAQSISTAKSAYEFLTSSSMTSWTGAAQSAGTGLQNLSFSFSGDASSALYDLGTKVFDNSQMLGQVGAGLSYLSAVYSLSQGKYMTGIGTAIGTYFGGPVGAALGNMVGGFVDKIFGFGKKKPAPIEWQQAQLGENQVDADGKFRLSQRDPGNPVDRGPFGPMITLGQHLSRNGMSMEELRKNVTLPMIELDKILAQFMTDQEKTAAQRALELGNNLGELGWGQAQVEQVMANHLNVISNSIGGWTDKIFDTVTGTIAERYTALAKLLALRDNDSLSGLADELTSLADGGASFKREGEQLFDTLIRLAESIAPVNAVLGELNMTLLNTNLAGASAASGLLDKFGGAEGFVGATGAYYDAFFSDAEKLANVTEGVTAEFTRLNIAMPESSSAFRELVEGLDLSATSGQDMFVALMAVAPAFNTISTAAAALAVAASSAAAAAAAASVAYAQSAADDAMNAADRTFNGVVRAIGKQREIQVAAFNAAQEIARKAEGMVTTLADVIRRLRGLDVTTPATLALARANIASMITGARAGVLPNENALSSAAQIMQGDSMGNYATKAEYLRSQAKSANQLELLAGMIGGVGGGATTLMDAARRQIDILDNQLEKAQQQIDALHGIDTSVKSVSDAISSLATAIAAARTAQGAVASAGTTDGIITNAYGQYLHRAPEAGALNAWKAQIAGGLPVSTVVDQIRTSNESQVQSLYATMLGRVGEAAGVAYWTNQLNQGVAFTDIVQGFKNSIEYFNTNNIPFPLATGTNFVPQDMLAQLHAGEEVTPRAYVNAREAGSETLIAEMRGLREEVVLLRAEARATARNTSKANQQLDSVINGGESFTTAAAS